MTTFNEDYKYGKEQERKVFPTLKRFFGQTLRHNIDDFAPFDFEDDEQALEMKSRKFLSSEYNDVMIKTLKIEHCEKDLIRECFLIFKFYDKLCYIQYNKTKFKKYKKRIMLIKSRSDKAELWESRTFIPLADLLLIRNYPVTCMID